MHRHSSTHDDLSHQYTHVNKHKNNTTFIHRAEQTCSKYAKNHNKVFRASSFCWFQQRFGEFSWLLLPCPLVECRAIMLAHLLPAHLPPSMHQSIVATNKSRCYYSTGLCVVIVIFPEIVGKKRFSVTKVDIIWTCAFFVVVALYSSASEFLYSQGENWRLVTDYFKHIKT